MKRLTLVILSLLLAAALASCAIPLMNQSSQASGEATPAKTIDEKTGFLDALKISLEQYLRGGGDFGMESFEYGRRFYNREIDLFFADRMYTLSFSGDLTTGEGSWHVLRHTSGQYWYTGSDVGGSTSELDVKLLYTVAERKDVLLQQDRLILREFNLGTAFFYNYFLLQTYDRYIQGNAEKTDYNGVSCWRYTAIKESNDSKTRTEIYFRQDDGRLIYAQSDIVSPDGTITPDMKMRTLSKNEAEDFYREKEELFQEVDDRDIHGENTLTIVIDPDKAGEITYRCPVRRGEILGFYYPDRSYALYLDRAGTQKAEYRNIPNQGEDVTLYAIKKEAEPDPTATETSLAEETQTPDTELVDDLLEKLTVSFATEKIKEKSYPFRGEDVQSYSNGDSVYIPPAESLIRTDEGISYYPNLIDVYLTEALSKEEASAIAESIGGRLAGLISGTVNSMQIYVEETSLEALEDLAARLMATQPKVVYANYTYAMEGLSLPTLPEDVITEPFRNPETSKDEPKEQRGTEDKPSGNDEAYEAVGAYKAWELAKPVAISYIGLMDNGVQADHEELEGKILSMNLAAPFDSNTPDLNASHGTNTASIMAAAVNGKGIRGINSHARIYNVDIYNHTQNAITFAQIREIVKQFLEHDAKTILLECAVCVNDASYYYDKLRPKKDEHLTDDIIELRTLYEETRKAWTDAQFLSALDIDITAIEDKLNENYGSEFYWDLVTIEDVWKMSFSMHYADYMIESALRLSAITGFDTLLTMAEVLKEGKDFLLVHPAGNGLNWSDSKSLDAESTGGFAAAIGESLFNDAASGKYPSVRKLLEGLSYDDIKSHLLVVSGTHLDRYENGSYKRDGTNNGQTIDICAPSEKILTACCDNLTVKNKYTATFGGTSGAGPFVAGAASLLWSCAPELSGPQIRECLIESSLYNTVKKNENGEVYESYPMLNIGSALEYASEHYGVTLRKTGSEMPAFTEENIKPYLKMVADLAYAVLQRGTGHDLFGSAELSQHEALNRFKLDMDNALFAYTYLNEALLLEPLFSGRFDAEKSIRYCQTNQEEISRTLKALLDLEISKGDFPDVYDSRNSSLCIWDEKGLFLCVPMMGEVPAAKWKNLVFKEGKALLYAEVFEPFNDVPTDQLVITLIPAKNELGFTIESISLNPKAAADSDSLNIMDYWGRFAELCEKAGIAGTSKDADTFMADPLSNRRVTLSTGREGKCLRIQVGVDLVEADGAKADSPRSDFEPKLLANGWELMGERQTKDEAWASWGWDPEKLLLVYEKKDGDAWYQMQVVCYMTEKGPAIWTITIYDHAETLRG